MSAHSSRSPVVDDELNSPSRATTAHPKFQIPSLTPPLLPTRPLWLSSSSCFLRQCRTTSDPSAMSDITPQTNTPYPEPPAKKRNDLAIELISGSVGGATQVLVGQVSGHLKR